MMRGFALAREDIIGVLPSSGSDLVVGGSRAAVLSPCRKDREHKNVFLSRKLVIGLRISETALDHHQ